MNGLDLKIERVRNRVTQMQVAALVGRSNAWLYSIEADKRQPSENEIQAIQQAIAIAARGETAALVPLERKQ